MTESAEIQSMMVSNEETLQHLIRSIELCKGRRFSLIMVRCNYHALRDAILDKLRDYYKKAIQEVRLAPSRQNLFKTIQKEVEEVKKLKNKTPDALMILELEEVEQLDELLIGINGNRDEFRDHFSFPLIFWLTDEVYKKLMDLAPDFHSWAAGPPIIFKLTSEPLTELLNNSINAIFTSIVETLTVSVIDSSVIPSKLKADRYEELESAKRDLQTQGQSLAIDLEANLRLAQGREYYLNSHSTQKVSPAVAQYKQSLQYWQKVGNKQREGILLFCISLCYQHKAQLKRARQERYCQVAKKYIEQCCDVFKQAKRDDLFAKFISKQGETLEKLKQWAELENLANESIDLHKNSPVHLAQDFGFLAAVAFSKKNWQDGKIQAQKALRELEQVPEKKQLGKGKYLYLLAKAQQYLENFEDALNKLKEAKSHQQSKNNTDLYINILTDLERLYKEQHQYLEALNIKQERRIFEGQCGLRAFIGAVSLEPQYKRTSAGTEELVISPAIEVSHRQQDVDKLINDRIRKSEYRLTIIHGQSGVGKSSLINAGLVPRLKKETKEGQDFLVLPLKVYNDWQKKIGKLLKEELEANERIDETQVLEKIETREKIVEQLKKNSEIHVTSILIFDQFEEFFFNCPEEDRQIFFEFLEDCRKIDFLYVILSLRQDHLHYLLEWERFKKTDEGLPWGRDILKLDNRYELNNFSSEDAKAIIKKLTEKSQINLETGLIEKLVEDISNNLGQVRPIELQIIGDQLQAKKIITLEKYEEFGDDPKNELVKRYLDEVVNDCGTENQEIAQLVLFLLTEENNTRPLKTRENLKSDLKHLKTRINVKVQDTDLNLKVDLVLDIFVKSGLVMLLSEVSTQRYQLVHDYLVGLIREEQQDIIKKLTEELDQIKQLSDQLQAANTDLKKEKEERDKVDGKLTIVQKELENKTGKLEDTQKKLTDTKRQISQLCWLSGGLAVIGTLTGIILTSNAHRDLREMRLEKNAGKLEINIKQVKEGKGKNDNFTELLKTSMKLSNQAKSLVNPKIPDFIKIPFVSTPLEKKAFDRLLMFNIQQMIELVQSTADTHLMHEGKIDRISFSPNGQKLATVSTDNILRLWNREGELLGESQKKEAIISDIQFTPDGKKIATVSEDKYIRFYELEEKKKNLKEIQEYKQFKNKISNLKFSFDGKKIIANHPEGYLTLWNLQDNDNTPHEIKVNESEISIVSMTFSEDGEKIAIGLDDGTIRVYYVKEGKLNPLDISKNAGEITSDFKDGKIDVPKIQKKKQDGSDSNKPHENLEFLNKYFVADLYFRNEGQELVFVLLEANNNQSKLIVSAWNFQHQELTKLYEKNLSVDALTLSPKEQTLAMALRNSRVITVDLLDENNSELEYNIPKGRILDLSFDESGKELAAASKNGIVSWWKFKENRTSTPEQYQHLILLAETEDNKNKKVSLQNVNLMHRSQQQNIASISPSVAQTNFTSPKKLFLDIQYSPNGDKIATASQDGTVTLWDIEWDINGQKLPKVQKLFDCKASNSGVYSIDFNRDGTILVAASIDGEVRLWDIKKETKGVCPEAFTNLKLKDKIWDVSFSPDGNTIAIASENQSVSLWDWEGNSFKTYLKHSAPVLSLDFSEDGKYLATGSADNYARLWEIEKSHEAISGIPHQAPVLSVSLRQKDGKYLLATGSGDSIARLWEWKSVEGMENEADKKAELITEFQGHQRDVRDVSFYTYQEEKQELYLATASEDKTIRLWTLEGYPMAEFNHHQTPVRSISLHPTKNWLASASIFSEDGTIGTASIRQIKSLDELLNEGCEYLKSYLTAYKKTMEKELPMCFKKTSN
ncbi:MAG: hypothetical protein QNJ37_11625 [Crocosphaera sp.]|nr:hypothetical protein [Crocosphaera sp.]